MDFKLQIKRPKLNVPVRNILFYLILLVMIYPPALSYYSFFIVFQYIQYILSIFGIIVFFYRFLNDKFMRWMLVFFCFFLLSTFINHSSYNNVFYYFSRCFGAIVFCCVFYHIDYTGFWNCMCRYFTVLVVLNTLLTIILPQGLFSWENVNSLSKGIYLLGEANQVIPFYLISITVCTVRYWKTNNGRNLIFLLFICIWIAEMIYGSSTSLVGVFLLTILYIWFFLISPHRKETHSKRYIFAFLGIIVAFLLYYGIVILRIQDNFSFVFEQIFGKSSDFSTRSVIWSAALQMIGNSFLFGYGGTDVRYILIGNSYFSAHDIFLQLFLMGGILLVLVFVRIVIDSISHINQIKEPNIRICLAALLIVLAVISLTEVYTFSLLFFALFLPEVAYDYQKQEQGRLLKRKDTFMGSKSLDVEISKQE